ncbi:MAG: hypothetical protein WCG60_02500, partial [bacterium]
MKRTIYFIFVLLHLLMLQMSFSTEQPCAFNRYEDFSIACSVATYLAGFFAVIGIISGILLFLKLFKAGTVWYRVIRM